MMNMPEIAKYVRVDVIIECYDITKACELALLHAMPNAYGGEAPGEDSWPEPDHSRDNGYRLSDCWSKLPTEIQAELITVLNN